MKQILETAVRVFLSALGVFGIGWLFYRSLKRSDNPPRLIFKWIFTAAAFWFLFQVAIPLFSKGGMSAMYGLALALVVALFMAATWRHSIAAVFAKPFGSLYDGGNEEIEPRPFYSVAMAKRGRGNYVGAVAEIHKQLDRFPDDVEGQMLLAEIQGANLNDLSGAELTIQRFIAQPGHTPASVASALNSLADWHLKYAQDREGAQRSLQKIIEMLPNTEWSNSAAQRIAHLGDKNMLLAPHDRRRIKVVPGVQNVGLLPPEQQPKAPEVDPAKLAGELVEHLEQHPLDTEAREKLAVIYADHYGRLSLAADQLEQLIGFPNQPVNKVAHWLNLLADLQLRHSADYETVRQTLQRIVDIFPNTAPAKVAENRLAHLKLELKGKEKGRTVTLGTYEQDIGLKYGSPHRL